MIIIELEKERSISWNKSYAGKHWTERKEDADYLHGLFIEHRMKRKRQGLGPLTRCVDIMVIGYFVKSPLDADNIAAKYYIDGLKGWLLVDDSFEYVRTVTTQSKYSTKKSDYIVILISDCAETDTYAAHPLLTVKGGEK